MQLSHLFVRAGKAAWLLLLVPLVAVAGTLTVLAGLPADVHTIATVSVIAPEGRATAATVTQAVDSFRSAAVSENVIQLASQDAGVSLSPDRDLAAERVGTSNLVELQVTTQGEENGPALVRALVARTNEAVFASTLASNEARVDTAQTRYDDAVEERARESASTGLLLPIESYRAKASEVTQLRVALATTLGDSTVNRAAVQDNLRAAAKELNRIGDSVEAFQSLEDSVFRTRADLATANQELDTVQTRLTAASSDESVTISEPREQSRRTTLVRGGVAALVLGLATAAGLILLLGLLIGPRRPTRVQ